MLAFFQCLTLSGTWSLCDTCWWYSLCHFQDRQQHYETVGFIRTCIYFYFYVWTQGRVWSNAFFDVAFRTCWATTPVWMCLNWRYVKSLSYMSVVLVVSLPVPTTFWTYMLGSLWLLNVYEPVFLNFDVSIQGRVWSNLFSMWLIFSCPDCCGNGVRVCRTEECTWSLCYTCWWYSLCNFQYRQHYENTCSYNVDCWIYTNLYFYIFILCVNTRTSIKQD